MEAMRWHGDALELIDQRALPDQERWLRCRSAEEVARAITEMVVRGAPAIAIAAAYGLALAEHHGEDVELARARLAGARPTAVNLRWALDRLRPPYGEAAVALHREDVAINLALSAHGAPLLDGGVLTICNTGSLATGGHGTALGMVRTARASGRDVHLYACETRPYRQGARLTAWECDADGIPCTVIADGAAGALMAAGRVRSVVVGCDRVAANGDVANKLGTLNLAILASYHRLPFWVAMPRSSLDPSCPDGPAIPIEERSAAELIDLAPFTHGTVDAWNPAFDVVPAALVTGWVSERGVERRWRGRGSRGSGASGASRESGDPRGRRRPARRRDPRPPDLDAWSAAPATLR
jgi:methylthioribose-1-phosphate isomerase